MVREPWGGGRAAAKWRLRCPGTKSTLWHCTHWVWLACTQGNSKQVGAGSLHHLHVCGNAQGSSISTQVEKATDRRLPLLDLHFLTMGSYQKSPYSDAQGTLGQLSGGTEPTLHQYQGWSFLQVPRLEVGTRRRATSPTHFLFSI